MNLIQFIKTGFMEPPGETCTKGKWRTFPVMTFCLLIPILILNIHMLGWIGWLFVFPYLGLFWLGLQYLHYSDDQDPILAFGMTVAELLSIVGLLVTMIALLMGETEWTVSKTAYATYENQHREWVARKRIADQEATTRQEIANAGLQSIAEIERQRTEREVAAAKREKMQALRLEKEMTYYRKTGIARQMTFAQPSPTVGDSNPLDSNLGNREGAVSALVSVAGPATEPAPIAPESPEECLRKWQSRIKWGQGAEFLFGICALAFLRIRSMILNWRYRLGRVQALKEEEKAILFPNLAGQNRDKIEKGIIRENTALPFPADRMLPEVDNYLMVINDLGSGTKYDKIGQNTDKIGQDAPKYDKIHFVPDEIEDVGQNTKLAIVEELSPFDLQLEESKKAVGRVEADADWIGVGYFVTRDGRRSDGSFNLSRRFKGKTTKSGRKICTLSETELKNLRQSTPSQRQGYLIEKMHSQNLDKTAEWRRGLKELILCE